jgi:hypothetical protein
MKLFAAFIAWVVFWWSLAIVSAVYIWSRPLLAEDGWLFLSTFAFLIGFAPIMLLG